MTALEELVGAVEEIKHLRESQAEQDDRILALESRIEELTAPKEFMTLREFCERYCFSYSSARKAAYKRLLPNQGVFDGEIQAKGVWRRETCEQWARERESAAAKWK